MKHLLGLLTALAVVHGLLYAFLIPPWQAPDEIAHFEYARLLAERWRPLSLADASPALEAELIDSLYRFQAWTLIGAPTPLVRPTRLLGAPFFGKSSTLQRFSLAYVPYALAVRPFLAQNVVTQLYLMRIVSVLLSAVVVGLGFGTAQQIEPDSPALAIGTALFLIFLPQHAFIMAVVNDGNLAEGLASLTIYLLIKMQHTGLTWRRAALCLGCALASLQIKTTALFLIPLVIIVGLALLRPSAILGYVRQHVWQSLGVLLLLGAGILPWVLFSAQMAYLQQLFNINRNNWGSLAYYLSNLIARDQLSFFEALWRLFKSYWLTFGWMSLPLKEERWYDLLLVLSAISLLGLWLRFRVQRRRSDNTSIYAILALAAGLPIAILLILFVVFLNYPYQGRFLFAGIMPQAVLLVGGWLSLFPRRYASSGLWVILSGLLALDVVSIGFTIIPFYYHG